MFYFRLPYVPTPPVNMPLRTISRTLDDFSAWNTLACIQPIEVDDCICFSFNHAESWILRIVRRGS